MSLVIALAASRQAVIAADRRAILFMGSCPPLEAELYSGQIKDDRELEVRTEALGAVIQVSNSREKVWRRGDVLVGEVTELSPRLQRRRRIYIAPGASLQVEIRSGEGAGSVPESREQSWRLRPKAARPGSKPGAVWGAQYSATDSLRSWRRRRSPGPGQGWIWA